MEQTIKKCVTMNQIEYQLQNLPITNEIPKESLKTYYTKTVLKELLEKPLISLITCNKCNKCFDGNNFKYDKKKQEYHKHCVLCKEKQKKYSLTHYEKHKDNEEYKERVKVNRVNHKEGDAYKQTYELRKQDDKVRERKNQLKREYREKNLEKVREQARLHYKTFYEKNKETPEYKEQRRLNRKEYDNKETRNIYQNKRRNDDIIVKLRDNVSRRINKSLKSYKSITTIEYLDCSMEFFKTRIEKQFTDKMSWDNYGRNSGDTYWEIDHIIPIKYENPTLDEVKKRLHYTNCQPMWAVDNRKKSNRFIG